MTETTILINNIVKASQEKKAKDIVIVNLSEFPGAICQSFIVCQGNTPTQVEAIANEIIETTKKNIKERPLSVDGLRESRWVGIDYGTVIVHVFIPELREFYDIEHLWEDAPIEIIPNLD